MKLNEEEEATQAGELGKDDSFFLGTITLRTKKVSNQTRYESRAGTSDECNNLHLLPIMNTAFQRASNSMM